MVGVLLALFLRSVAPGVTAMCFGPAANRFFDTGPVKARRIICGAEINLLAGLQVRADDGHLTCWNLFQSELLLFASL